MALGRRQSINL